MNQPHSVGEGKSDKSRTRPQNNWREEINAWLKKRGLKPSDIARQFWEEREAIDETQRLLGTGYQPFGVERFPAVYLAIPGHRNRATSREAAAAMAPRCRDLRARVLTALRRRAMTADEVATWLGESILSIRPRCTELFRLGQIADSGLTRRNVSGRAATVWKLSA